MEATSGTPVFTHEPGLRLRFRYRLSREVDPSRPLNVAFYDLGTDGPYAHVRTDERTAGRWVEVELDLDKVKRLKTLGEPIGCRRLAFFAGLAGKDDDVRFEVDDVLIYRAP